VIPPRPGYLEGLRRLCSEYGVVLIFDEVITGFRVSLAGAQGYYGVEPDLSIFGKAIANGIPMSCIAGRADIFALIAQGKVGHGGTYNSLPPSIAAALAATNVLARNGGEVYRRLEETGAALMHGIRQRAAKLGIPVTVQGHPSIFFVGFPKGNDVEVYDYRSSLKMNNELYSQFVCGLADRGVRLIPRGNWFLSAAHNVIDVEETLTAVEDVLTEIARS
jgi:glutamate-1-semialdehyde 2,1-aminomutase